MRVTRKLSLLVLGACLGCDPALATQLGLVNARDLSGTYTGVLEGISITDGAPQPQVIVDVDLLHELRVRAVGDMTLRIESDVIPPVRAIVLGSGPVAMNVEFLEFEGVRFDTLKVKQIVFVQYEGEWIVVLQLVRVPEVYLYQYVSYPSRVARQMSRDEAIQYVNTILRLLSAAQRSSSG